MGSQDKSTTIFKCVELIVISIGIAISVFTLIEIRKQTQVNAEQISVLKLNSEIANRLTIFRDFYPKYAIRDVQKITKGTAVGVKLNITNYSDVPLAYDNYVVYKLYNCGTRKNFQYKNIKRESVEKALRDNNHHSVAPGNTEQYKFLIDIALSEDAMREVKVTNANFVLVMYTFLRLENIEYFDDFVKEVGFDLSDDFKINSELANLPPNTKRVNFEVPIKWDGSTFEIADFKGCGTDTDPQENE